MSELRSLMFCCAALFSCTNSQPAAPTATTPTPAVTPQAAKVVHTPAQPPPAAKPEPEPAGSAMPYPEGIVPANDELAGKIVRPEELAVRTPIAGPLAQVDECGAAPDECGYPAGVLGFNADGRVAVIEAPVLPGCGEDIPLDSWGRVGRPEALASAAKVHFKPGKGDGLGGGKAFAFVKAQADAGFKDPDDLVFLTAGGPVGIDGVVSHALLRAPLAGWLLHVAGDELKLVDPANKKAHVIGKLPSRGKVPSIEQVVVDPGHKHLFVTVAFNDGGHCSELPVSVLHWPLPDGVVAAP